MNEVISKADITKEKIINEKKYRIIGVRAYGKGAYLNRTVSGKDLKMRVYQICPKHHLIWCKVDTKNGAFGIVTDELDGCYASSNMSIAKIDTNKINEDYLQILFKMSKFNAYMDTSVTGSTNRKYLRFDQILNTIKIPFPPLSIQNQLVSAYQNRLQQAEEAEAKANELEKSIESYLLSELGIEIHKVDKSKKKGLQFVAFSEVSRWDFDYLLNQSSGIFAALNKSKFKSIKLGNVYNFITRSWSKHKHKEKTFRYIEIGSVDTFLGISGFTEKQTPKAPSRATQMVQKNDLILGLTRPYLKKFALVSEKYDGYVCSSGFQVIAPSENYSLEFLLEFLKSEAGVKQFEFFMTGGLYPAITAAQLRDLEIPLPPLSIQTAIVSHINEQKAEIKRLKAEAEKLRKEAKEEFEREVFEN